MNFEVHLGLVCSNFQTICAMFRTTQTHGHTDTQPHRQLQIELQSITNFHLCMENPSIKEEKNLIQKPYLLQILF